MGRSAEEVYYGAGAVSQLSAADMAKAAELAHFLTERTSLGASSPKGNGVVEGKGRGRGRGRGRGTTEDVLREAYCVARDFVRAHTNAINVLAASLLRDVDVSREEVVGILEACKGATFPGSLTFRGKASGSLTFNSMTSRPSMEQEREGERKGEGQEAATPTG